MTKEIVPTDEQQLIFDAARTMSKGDTIAVQARAGTGKTTTLALVSKLVQPSTIRYCGYNRALVQEAKRRFDKSVVSTTGHGLAHRALRLTKEDVVSHYTPQQICEILNLQAPATDVTKELFATRILKTLENYCNSDAVIIDEPHVPAAGLTSAAQKHGCIQGARQLWLKILTGEIKPIHDHYLKDYEQRLVTGLLTPPSEDYLLFDEAQDANPVLRSIVKHSYRSKRILVGDPYQQIYGWRGAENALASFNGLNLYLTQTHRFGSEICAWANYVLGWHPSPPTNRIQTSRKDGIVCFANELDLDNTVHLCRTRAKGFELALAAAQSGQSIYLEGDFNKQMTLFLDLVALKEGRQKNVYSPQLRAHGSWSSFRDSHDYRFSAEMRRAADLVELVGCKEILRLHARVKELLTTEELAEVKISTVHAMKGKEAENIQLAQDLIEPFEVLDAADSESLDELAEEICILYVAITRARSSLILPDQYRYEAHVDKSSPAMPPLTFSDFNSLLAGLPDNISAHGFSKALHGDGFGLKQDKGSLFVEKSTGDRVPAWAFGLSTLGIERRFPNYFRGSSA